jgi:predicted HicB family RNase H-like nuclease
MSLIESKDLTAEIERILAERRKATEKVTFTLRTPRDRWPLVQEAAHTEGVSLQEWVQRAIATRLAGDDTTRGGA